MKSLLGLGFILFGMVSVAEAATNATSAKLLIYKAYLSESGDCSNPVLLVDNGDTAQEFNMMSSPTIGEGSIPPKVYKCLIMEMSDKIKYIPSANDGANCTAGTEYTRYVCRSANTKNATTGASVACTGADSQSGEDKVWVYVSRWAANDGSGGSTNAFQPPTFDGDSSNGMKLQNDIDVSNGTGSFIFDLTGKVDGSSSPCDMQPPKFGFRNG